MPTTSHIATINAFENKFGSFTGAIRDEVTRERFPTYDDACNFVKTRAWEMFGPVRFASIPRKGEYLANVWKAN